MRKSNKCEYTIGVNTKKKRKFLRPEEAMAEAARLNELPHVIKKCVAYKCTVCYFFHVGRTHEDLPRGPIMIPQPEPEEIMDEVVEQQVSIDPLPADNFNWEIKKEPDKIEYKDPIKIIEQIKQTPHDDFDWETDKKLI